VGDCATGKVQKLIVVVAQVKNEAFYASKKKKLVARVLAMCIRVCVGFRLWSIAAFAIGRAVWPLGGVNSGRSPVLLGLNAHEFRGELEVLGVEGFDVIALDPITQTHFCTAFIPGIGHNSEYFNITEGHPNYVAKRALNKFANVVFSKMFQRANVRAVVIHDLRVWFNDPITQSAVANSIPVILINRESFLIEKRTYLRALARHEYLRGAGVVKPSLALVNNAATRRMLTQSKVVEPDRVQVVGNCRMDRFIERSKELTSLAVRERRGNRTVLLISSLYSLEDQNLNYRLADEVHEVFAEVARSCKSCAFIMKFKPGHQSSAYFKHIYRKLAERDLLSKNLSILFEESTQDLLIESDAIVGIFSTALLEGAILGREVILPLFSEYTKSPDYSDYGFANNLDLFTVVRSREAYRRALSESIVTQNPCDAETLAKRRAFFSEWVSPIEGGAVESTVRSIGSLVGFPGDRPHS